MKAMILAAGYGTRFRPATYEIPKPLIPLCNQPLIDYAMEALLAAGVTDFAINLHHAPERLQAWLERTWGDRCRLHFSFEPTILGTGGGVRKLRDFLETDEEFFLMNGDTVQDPPLLELLEARRKSDALAALVLRRPPENDRFTSVFHEDGFVNGIAEGHGQALMFAGCHVLSRRIFDVLPDRDFSGITEDVYIPVLSHRREKIAAVVDDGYWFDIGTPKRYLDAADALGRLILEGEAPVPPHSIIKAEAIIDRTARVDGSVKASSIGPDCTIGANSVVTGSAVWASGVISEGSRVDRSIIAEKVELPAETVVQNALVCRRLDGVDYPAGALVTDRLVAVAIDQERPFRFELS